MSPHSSSPSDRPQLRFFFDFLIPDCYVAWMTLRQAPALGDVTVQVVPVETYPPHRTAPPAELLGPDDKRWAPIGARGRVVGAEIKPPAVWLPSHLALRGALGYDEFGRLDEYMRGVFKAVFVDGIDITKAQPITTHLQSEGVDIIPFSAALADNSTETQLRELQTEVRSLRLRLLPTFMLGDERLAGVVDRTAINNLLSRAGAS